LESQAVGSYKMIEKHLVKLHSIRESNVELIDGIFLINLDQRPEKLERTLSQFQAYKIHPNRLPAIYGWTLPNEVFEDVGLKLRPKMEWSKSILMHNKKALRVTKPSLGSAIFYPRMSLGAVGTALSHLSVLQNAADAGFETIWVLEDDVKVQKDPYVLSDYIRKLDKISPDWDVLYTDDVTYFEPFTPGTVYRPDMPDIDFEPMFIRKEINNDFFQIGGRCQAHSMIIRKKAIRKILEFEQSRGIYLPYDVEIAFVPQMKFYNLRHNIVVGGTLENSDTIHKYFT
jgi:GR25 family glycosyltransferase involved in LPS biosynthesis